MQSASLDRSVKLADRVLDRACLSTAIHTVLSPLFFFQAKDGIRCSSVTGVQTCALPICYLDTRHSGHLLRHFEIAKPLVSYHEHNEARRTEELVKRLAAGQQVALITDAGLPGISRSAERRVGKEGRSRWSPDH